MKEIILKEMESAIKKNEVPIAAIILKNGKIIAKAHNNVEKNNNPLGHAEILVIQKAAKKLKTWKLNDCELYVTLEPCAMCKEMIKRSRIDKIYYFVDKKDKKMPELAMQKIILEDLNEQIKNKIISFFVDVRNNKKI